MLTAGAAGAAVGAAVTYLGGSAALAGAATTATTVGGYALATAVGVDAVNTTVEVGTGTNYIAKGAYKLFGNENRTEEYFLNAYGEGRDILYMAGYSYATFGAYAVQSGFSSQKSESGSGTDDVVEISLSKTKYPESAQHIEDAIKNGQPDTLTINRSGAMTNRRVSLKGINKVPGAGLDEYPPAMFKEGGQGASVRPINPSDNRGAGSTIGHRLRPYPDGTKIKINITE